MKLATLLSLLILFSLMACNSDDEDNGNSILGQTTEFDFGTGVPIDDSGIVLSFIGIEESRCPSTVTCVTAGEAKATFILIGNTSILDTVELVSPGSCFEEDGSCGETKKSQGYSIQLLSINPYPETLITVGPNEYKTKVIVERE